MAPQKTEQEIQEEEELQLALALSQSEAETKQKEVIMHILYVESFWILLFLNIALTKEIGITFPQQLWFKLLYNPSRIILVYHVYRCLLLGSYCVSYDHCPLCSSDRILFYIDH